MKNMKYDIDQMHYLVLHIGEATCAGNWNYKNVCSPFTRIYYILDGTAQIMLADEILQLIPGHMYIIPAFIQHSCICAGKFRHFYIHIYNDADHDMLEDWELPHQIVAPSDILPLIRELYNLCPGMALVHTDPQSYDNSSSLNMSIQKNKQRDVYVRVMSRGIIYRILAEFLKGAKPKEYVYDSRIAKVVQHIRMNIGARPDLDELASISCMSKDHLTRIFRREMKVTPLSYYCKKKMEKAQLRLVTETISVKEIALQLGYDDQAYFNRIFKKFTGMSPSAYRKNYQGRAFE